MSRPPWHPAAPAADPATGRPRRARAAGNSPPPRIDGPSRGARSGRRVAAVVVAAVALAGCGSSDGPTSPPADADPPGDVQPPPPGPGPWFSVTPIPLDSVARITPLGHNNKTIPNGHTYWDTCDLWSLMPSGRCVRQRLGIRAPRDAVVAAVEPRDDGRVVLEGPPGLFMVFSHVTPAAGLERGDAVAAGEVVATMYYDHGFDFGVEHFGLPAHPLLRPERAPRGYLHAQSPIAQYPEPLRSALEARVQTEEDPLGTLAFDVPGTAQGMWFRPGTPDTLSFHPDWADASLFLGPLQERHSTRILVSGRAWPGSWAGLTAVDSTAPDWTEVTPGRGPVAVRAWNLSADGTPDLTFPRGSWLVEMVESGRLRLEWFDTHDPPSAFTDAALEYER